jgi:hypothetical protein
MRSIEGAGILGGWCGREWKIHVTPSRHPEESIIVFVIKKVSRM